jgi:hypothetical protein
MRDFLVGVSPDAREKIQRHVEIQFSRNETPDFQAEAIREERSCHTLHAIVIIIGIGNTLAVFFAD